MVLGCELAFLRGATPRWPEVLHLTGIVAISELVALASADHTQYVWLGSRDSYGAAASDYETARQHAEVHTLTSFTPLPPTLDRRALLRERLLGAMGEGRAWSH